MAELHNRDELEAEFASKLARVFARHRRELLVQLGDPPRAENVLPEFWTRVQRETEDETFALLLLIFSASMIQHGAAADEVTDITSRGWAAQRAHELSVELTKTSREWVQDNSDKWRAVTDMAVAAVVIATTTPIEGLPVRPAVPSVAPPTKTQIREDLQDVFGPKRVEVIAVNETTTARHRGSETAVRATVGLSENDIWWTEDDDNVCPICTPLHQTLRSVWSMMFPSGPPSPHARCVLPGQVVNIPGHLEAAAKSFYDGISIEIRLENGCSISVTENHPILTSKGWVAAGLIDEGSDVFSSLFGERIVATIHPNDDNRPTLIEEVFTSFRMSDSVVSTRMPSTAKHFHGDGQFIHGEIEIVGSNSFLRSDNDADSLHHRPEHGFDNADMRSGRFVRRGNVALVSERQRNSNSCSVCGSVLSFPDGLRHLTPLDRLGFRLAADRDSCFDKMASNNGPINRNTIGNGLHGFTGNVASNKVGGVRENNILGGVRELANYAVVSHQLIKSHGTDADLGRKFVNRFSGEVSLSKAIQVNRQWYSGHVYDLQVGDNELYICNGVVVHNCRCWIVYAVLPEGKP